MDRILGKYMRLIHETVAWVYSSNWYRAALVDAFVYEG